MSSTEFVTVALEGYEFMNISLGVFLGYWLTRFCDALKEDY